MSDTTPPTASGEAAPASAPPSPVKKGNVLGLVGFILAIVGLVLAVIPGPSFAAWAPLIPALILSIIGLTRKSQPHGLALAGVIIAPIAWIIAIVVSIVGIATTIPQTITAPPPASSNAQPSDQATDGGDQGSSTGGESGADGTDLAIGATATSPDGVSFTANSIKCGIKSVGPQFFKTKAKGQFCQATVTLKNGSNDSIDVYSSDFTGQIGDASYDADGSVSKFDGDYFTTKINPGLSAKCTIYIDIPKGSKLDYLIYQPLFSWTELKVKVS